MAIQTKLQKKYVFRMVAMIVVSLVLGVWGVYDYLILIPAKARAFERGQVCSLVKDALESRATGEAREKIVNANKAIEEELARLLNLGYADDGTLETPKSQDEVDAAIEDIKSRHEEQWFAIVLLFRAGLEHAVMMPAGGEPSEIFVTAYETAKTGVNLTGSVSKPGQFDRILWGLMFIACLPFVPYFYWVMHRAGKRVYRLDDDGTFHAPEGSWTREEIADIDMSKWMSKSIAFVVHEDGRRVKLDDYLYAETHRIVGALAAERYPEEWDADARPIGDDDEDTPDPPHAGEHDDADAKAAAPAKTPAGATD